MNYKITNFEKIMLRKICKRIVIQSPEHKNNIKEYYKIMFEESHKDFTEDNHITLTSFLFFGIS